MDRTWAVAWIVVIALSGCAGLGPVDGGTPTERLACPLNTSSNLTLDETGPTVSSQEVSDADAEDRALCAEKRFLRQRFEDADCLSQWSVHEWSPIAETNATAVNWTSSGVVVDVQLPYSHEMRGVATDDVSRAIYLITDERSVRIAGWKAEPC